MKGDVTLGCRYDQLDQKPISSFPEYCPSTECSKTLSWTPPTVHTESGCTVAQRLRHTASASLMHFPLVFKTVSDQADSVSSQYRSLDAEEAILSSSIHLTLLLAAQTYQHNC